MEGGPIVIPYQDLIGLDLYKASYGQILTFMPPLFLLYRCIEKEFLFWFFPPSSLYLSKECL